MVLALPKAVEEQMRAMSVCTNNTENQNLQIPLNVKSEAQRIYTSGFSGEREALDAVVWCNVAVLVFNQV